ncbi:MAG: hypothetical protein ACQEP5_00545 [Actinomycetota bacterium]
MRKYSILLSFTALLVILTLAGCTTPQAEPAETAGQPGSETDISDLDTLPVGQEITTGDIVWEIREVEDLGNQLTYEGITGSLEAEEGKFIAITFYIHNTGDDGKVIFDLTAIDDKGRSYSICLAAFAYFSPEEACVLQEIIPGVENTYSATFDVATDVNRLVLQVTDLEIPPQEVAYIDLDI